MGSSPRYSSMWLNDILNLEVDVGNNWFNSKVIRKVGHDGGTHFWNVPWQGDPFCARYPRLFEISN